MYSGGHTANKSSSGIVQSQDSNPNDKLTLKKVEEFKRIMNTSNSRPDSSSKQSISHMLNQKEEELKRLLAQKEKDELLKHKPKIRYANKEILKNH